MKERVNMSLSRTTADYLRSRAALELRTVSNMAEAMIEEYRRMHDADGMTSPAGDTMVAGEEAPPKLT